MRRRVEATWRKLFPSEPNYLEPAETRAPPGILCFPSLQYMGHATFQPGQKYHGPIWCILPFVCWIMLYALHKAVAPCELLLGPGRMLEGGWYIPLSLGGCCREAGMVSKPAVSLQASSCMSFKWGFSQAETGIAFSCLKFLSFLPLSLPEIDKSR